MSFRRRPIRVSPRRSALCLAALVLFQAPARATIVPDSTLLARVGSRTITAGLYIDNWVAGNALTRPAAADSAGRRQFLDILVNRELLRLAALEHPHPLDFADQTQLAEWREEALRNALYKKLVADSVVITDDDIRHMHAIKSTLLRIRRITCRTQQECAGLRARWARGEPWSQLVKASVDTSTVRKNGYVGMQTYLNMGMGMAQEVYRLKDGAVSQPLYDRGFWHLILVEGRHEMRSDPLESQYRSLREEVRRVKEAQFISRAEERFARERKVQYEADNLAFASRVFVKAAVVSFGIQGPEIDLTAVPQFEPRDTSRVLATSLSGRMTLGGFLDEFLKLNPLARPSIQTPEDLIHAINNFLFPPYLLQLAKEMHLDQTEYFQGEMQRVTANIQVDKLYADSVEKRLRITAKDLQRFYEKNKNLYFTYPQEHLFWFYRPSKQWAGALADSLKHGSLEPIAAMKQDSLLGRPWSEERIAYTSGPNDYRKLFQEMKNGEVRVLPDQQGATVLMRVELIPGRQLSYREAEALVDESVHNIKAEELLQSLLAKLRKRYPVTLYTRYLMDLDLTLI